MEARDSAGDVGANLEADGEDRHKDLGGTLVANARRVQEALRVLEEMAKNPGVALDPDKFKQARFSLYAVEKELFAKLVQ